MKLKLFGFLFLLLTIAACEIPPGGNEQNSGKLTTEDSTEIKDGETAPQSVAPPVKRGLKSTMDCAIEGKRMEDNEMWIKDQGLFVAILADSSTYDSDFGDSYRILSVYDTDNCKEIYRQVLPVNSSPDFPYYLSTNLYNEKSRLLCSQGFDATYCYDLRSRRPLPPIKPKYLSKRNQVDAQSGMPQGLRLKGQHLFGLVQDHGVFAYDISDRQNPVPLLPSAEYAAPDENVYPLFMIEEEKGKYQAIVMRLNEDESDAVLVDVFETPQAINPVLPANVRNNRFLVFNTGDRKIAIDMKKQRAVPLPEEIAAGPVQEVLKWLKGR